MKYKHEKLIMDTTNSFSVMGVSNVNSLFTSV